MQFYADGQVKFSDNSLDERFDRAFAYDHAARTTEAYSGSEARDFVNNTNTGAPTGPYRQSYQFSQFNQITQQTNRLWSDTQTTARSYTNNRRQGWSYDAAGFVTVAEDTTYTRDAAGRNVDVDDGASHGVYSFDGDGRMLKTVLTRPASVPQGTITTTIYYLNSTVLGGLAVAELAMNGQKVKSNVYAGSRKLATVLIDNTVNWSHEEPVTGSRGDSTAGGDYLARSEFNADGIDVGFAEPEETGFESSGPLEPWGALGLGTSCSSADPNCITCYVNGFEWDCNRVNWDLVKHCKDNDCGPKPKNSEPARPSTPPDLVPRNPDRPFDPNIEQPIRSQDGSDILRLLLSSLTAGSFTPQNPGANPLSKDHLKTVTDTIKLAQEMTDPSKHKGCDEALSKLTNGKISSLNSLINQYVTSGAGQRIFDGRKVAAGKYGTDNPSVPAFVLRTGSANATTYLNSKFFNFNGFGAAQARAIIMLHEAVHQFGGLSDVYFDPRKTPDQEVGSRKITNTIIDNCYPVLRDAFNNLHL